MAEIEYEIDEDGLAYDPTDFEYPTDEEGNPLTEDELIEGLALSELIDTYADSVHALEGKLGRSLTQAELDRLEDRFVQEGEPDADELYRETYGDGDRLDSPEGRREYMVERLKEQPAEASSHE